MSFTKLMNLVDELAENVTDPAAIDTAAAHRLVRPLRRAELADIVTEFVVDWARSAVRGRVLNIERDAMRRTEEQRRREADQQRRADLYLGKYKHGSMDQRAGAVLQGCVCERCRKVRCQENEWHRAYMAKLNGIMDDYAAELKAEWTEELLAASFAIDTTGVTVTWGEATVDQHERRIGMLTANASANIEAAARHRTAVNELRSTGAVNLRDLVTNTTVKT